jgi:hypothetical protein
VSGCGFKENAMMYVGFFSYNGKSQEDKPIYGDFACLIEADCPEDTEARFKEMLSRYKDRKIIFTRLKSVKVYQSSLIEVKTITKAGSLLSISELHGEPPKAAIDWIMPCKEKGLRPLLRKDQADRTDEFGFIHPTPFMKFGVDVI